jgi:hypothetical protein
MLVSIFFLLVVGSLPFAAPATLKTSNSIDFEDCGKKNRTFLKPVFLAYLLEAVFTVEV